MLIYLLIFGECKYYNESIKKIYLPYSHSISVNAVWSISIQKSRDNISSNLCKMDIYCFNNVDISFDILSGGYIYINNSKDI